MRRARLRRTRSLSGRAGVEARTARGPRPVPRDRRSRRRRDERRHLARTRRARRRGRRSRRRRRRMGCHVQWRRRFIRRARSMTRWRWRASLTGDGPTTNAGRSSAAARTSTASRFVAVSSGGTRSRPPSIVVSLAPNEKTTRSSPRQQVAVVLRVPSERGCRARCPDGPRGCTA